MVKRNLNSIIVVIFFLAFILASAFFMTTEAQSSQLAVNVSSPDEVNVCEPTNYTLYINNTGTEPAHNITVNISLPADFHYLNGSTIITFPNGTSNIDPVTSGQNLTWNLTPVVSSLGVNDTIKINFSAVTYCNASGGNLKATIYYDSKSTSTSSSSILVNKGLLLIEKHPQQQEAGVGDTANWTVRVTNIGTGPLSNVTIIDTLGSGLVLVSTNATSWPVWHYDRINVGESRTVHVAAKVMSCENLTNAVNATWGCHSVCQETFAQGAIKFIARPPDIGYNIEPDPIEVPYCGTATVWLNITNSGTGMAKDVRFFIKNMPSSYTITNVTEGTYYESNSTLYIGTINASSSKGISFQFGPKWQGRCSASSSGTLLFDPKYEDQCGNPWAAPPVKYISFSRQSAPSVNLDINGPNLLHVGENGTFEILATYHRGGCAYKNITTNITGNFPPGFVVIDSDGGAVNGSNITWYNVTLQDGIPWIRNVTLSNGGECGTMVSVSVHMNAVPDCSYCPISANSLFQLASVCPQNYTMIHEIAWNRTASPSYTENSHNITYYNNITFHVNASWGDIWFRERAGNGQTFYPQGKMNGTATFIINGSIYVSRNITLGQWFNLSFLSSYTDLTNGTTFSIIYKIHQWNTGTFVAWADLYIVGHPNPDSQDEMYHSGVWITVDRADYSIDIDIPMIVSDCGIYNATIVITNDSNWDCHDMVVVLNETNYFYINNSTSITGIKYYNETLGTYIDVPSFEPEIIGNFYIWNFSKHGYGKIHSGGSITVGIIKRCSSPASISAILSYKDNCNFEYVENAYDSPLMVTSGDLILLKTPEETFAYSRQLNWRIYVINKGNGTAFNVIADDILPKNLSYVSSTIDGAADPVNTTVNGNNITWYLGDMAPSEVKIIELTANLTGCEYVNNYAKAKWGCINGEVCQQVNDSSIVRLIVDQVLVIRHDITLIDRCGDEAAGTIVLKNGQTEIYDVNVTEYLPENLTYVTGSWSVDGATPSDFVIWRNNISWHFSYLPRGTTVTITFNVTISSPCADISQPAIAKVNYTLPCTTYGAEDTKDFIPQIAQPHLSITKTPDYISAKPGNVINWTITIISDGDYEAKNVTLHDILPSNADYISSSPSASAGNGSSLNPLIWNLSNMSVGSSISINISALVKSCTINDTVNNATIEWGCCPLARESNNAFSHLRTSPDIILSQSHSEITPCGGSFTITIHNNGSIANVSSIWFELPSGYLYKSDSAIIKSSNTSRIFTSQEPIDYSIINGTIVWDNGNIDFIYYNETITIHFEIVDDGINCANDITSYVNTTFHYRNACNNSFTTNASRLINPHHPLLGVNISPTIQVLNKNGSTATWAIYVSNNGDTTARNVSIASILGSAFQNSSIVVKFSNGSIDARAIVKDNSITWLNQTVPIGSNTWIRIIYANSSAGGATNHTVYVNGTCNSGCVYGSAKAKTFVARQNVSKSPEMVRTIGEYANFSINVSLWGVDEIYRNASVEDILPCGLIYVNSTIDGIWMPGNTTVAGQHIVWRLGNITGVKNVTINISTIVADVAGNQNGTTLLNEVTLLHDDGSGNIYSSTSNASVLILEPDLAITKNANKSIVEAGDIVNYTIMVQHTSASSWTAYDVWINDTIPEEMTYISNYSNPAADKVVQNGRHIAWYYSSIPEGTVITINYTVSIDSDIVANQDLINEANATWTSMAGSNEHERFGNETALDDYNRHDSYSIHANNNIVITKAVNKDNATIGEYLNYTIFVDLPKDTFHNVWINDTLPAGLVYDDMILFEANNASFAEDIVGQNVSWSLGDVNNSDNKDITIIFRAIVNNVLANQNGSAIQGNSAEFLGHDFNGNPVLVSSSSDTVTIRESSLSIEKLNNALLPVEGGNVVNYTILVYHDDNSSSDAYDVWINDTIPSKVQLLNVVFTVPPTIDNSSGRFLSFYYERILLINDSSNPIRILYRVRVLNNITINESLYNNATVEWTSVNNTFGNESYERKGKHTALNDYNDYDESSIRVRNSSIKLTKTVWNGSAWVDYYHEDIGDEVTFNITITNTGEASLVNITIKDVLPSGLINTTWGSSNTWSYPGPLLSGESIYIEFNATVIDSSIEINFANVTAYPYNITGKVYDEDNATVEGENASIELIKTVWNGSAWVDYYHEDIGDEVMFNITITNTGTNPIANVNVTDVLPSGLINTTWGSNHSWHIPLLEIGDSYTIIFNASVIQAGINTNYANVTGYCENTSKPVYDEDNATVEGENASIELIKTVWNGSAWIDCYDGDIGYVVTFNITITNTGTNPIANVNVTDVLPSGLINTTWGSNHSWHIPLLEIGDSYTIIFNASVIQAGINTNYANVTGYCENTSKPVYDEDNATVIVEPPNITDPKVATDINGPPLEPGDIICYTMWINNTGDMDSADNPGNEFEDTIPANTTYFANSLMINDVPNDDDISDSIGYDSLNNKIIWNGIISAHSSIKINFCVTVDLNASCKIISNQGIVYYDSDGDGTNDAEDPTDDPGTSPYNDPTNLTLDYTPPWSWLTVVLDPDGYIGSASTFHIYADDDLSLWKIFYKIDGIQYEGGWNQYVHFQINELHGYSPGSHTIEYWAIDYAGNEEKPHHIETYILDTEGPETTMKLEGIYEVTSTQKYQITTQTMIILEANDTGCGVASIHYKIDNRDWNEYTGAFTIDEEGIHAFYYCATDRLGNVGWVKGVTIQVGGGEPTTTCHITPEQPNGNNGWYVSSTTVTLTATDEASGVNYTMYRVDNGEWRIYTCPFVLETDGIHTIQYYSVDNAGNIETAKDTQVKIDLYRPTINVYKPTNFLYIFDRAILPLPTNKPLIIGKITIETAINDIATSGVDNAKLYIDNELKTTFVDSAEYTLDETMLGIHTIKIVAHDKAGNEAVKKIKIRIYNLHFSDMCCKT